MQIAYGEATLEEGFELLNRPKEERYFRGKTVSACSGWELFRSLKGGTIKCYRCGCEANRWIAEKGRTDYQGPPVLNLYGLRDGLLVLMTRDHIIPKSLGGVDQVENLRPACSTCNMDRGNVLTDEDLSFISAHTHLVSLHRLNKSREKGLHLNLIQLVDRALKSHTE